jgi:predicted metal-binding protein
MDCRCWNCTAYPNNRPKDEETMPQMPEFLCGRCGMYAEQSNIVHYAYVGIHGKTLRVCTSCRDAHRAAMEAERTTKLIVIKPTNGRKIR